MRMSRAARQLLANIDHAGSRLPSRERTCCVAHLFHAPTRDGIQGRCAKNFAGAPAEAGMMPWATNRIVDEKPIAKGGAIVRAGGADREQLVTESDKKYRLPVCMPEQNGFGWYSCA